MSVEAKYYEINNDTLICTLCPHFCRIKDGGIGFCLARKRIGEKLFSLNYGRLSAISLDPIEKKPLKMFMEGTKILSVGSFGCNFKCGFCQNYDISQSEHDYIYTSPEELVNSAYSLKEMDNIGIAYTYNEPSVMYEYVLDTAKLLKEKYDMKNVLVTNGYINEAPLTRLLKYVDALNVDLKSFDPGFYRDICKGSIDEVKKNLCIFNDNCHLEITTLIIGGYNDSTKEIGSLCRYISDISENIPLHLSRFYPAYKFRDEKPTPVEKMFEAKKIAEKYLKNVFLGNMP